MRHFKGYEVIVYDALSDQTHTHDIEDKSEFSNKRDALKYAKLWSKQQQRMVEVNMIEYYIEDNGDVEYEGEIGQPVAGFYKGDKV